MIRIIWLTMETVGHDETGFPFVILPGNITGIKGQGIIISDCIVELYFPCMVIGTGNFVPHLIRDPVLIFIFHNHILAQKRLTVASHAGAVCA